MSETENEGAPAVLNLTADQPPMVQPPVRPEPLSRPALATLITTEGTMVRLVESPGGGLTVDVGGRKPLGLDRWQYGAMRAALAARGEA